MRRHGVCPVMGQRSVLLGGLSAFLVSFLLLVACVPGATPEVAASPTTGLTATSTLLPSATATPTPTATPTATPAPTSTPTQTPTSIPTPTPTHPLMIEVMRQQDCPGSDIVIEETLAPGSNYHRYLASYLSDGLKIYALLTVPRGERPEDGWPVVIFNHGYIPPEQYRTTERYVAYVDAFARSGYIVLRSDYRGHGSSEGEPTNSYGSTDYTVDVLNAVAAVQRYPDADPHRIGMWGHSMGGSITLRAMVVDEDIRAGVIWAGVTAPYPALIARWEARHLERPTPTPDPEDSDRPWRPWTEELQAFGTFEENPAFWAAIDPFSYLDELSGPLQIHHGTADTSVPVAYSEILYEAVRNAGRDTELFLYPNDNHNISNNLAVALQRSVVFFDTHVKGVTVD